MHQKPAHSDATGQVELSIVMPCLNEAETLTRCIVKAQGFLQRSGIRGEVLIADNGSTDGSREIAVQHGAIVVPVTTRGYGAALQCGIAAANGRYVIMGDADDSYDFENLDAFVEKLREGNELVMGNRFKGGIKAGAMPPLHRYLGNPVLSFIGRLFFGSSAGDFHCGLRGFSRDAILRLDLRTTGMEFASEMVVKASLRRLRIAEVPTTLSPDGRSRPPHLRTWRDGWRHLRFLLMYCPRWLFLIPGILLMLAGSVVMLWLISGPRRIFGAVVDIHTMVYAAMAIVVGFQAVLFAIYTKVFTISEGLLPDDARLNVLFKYITLETGLIGAGILTLTGIILTLAAIFQWGGTNFGPVDPTRIMRLVIPGVTTLMLGVQLAFGSFFLSILGLRRR